MLLCPRVLISDSSTTARDENKGPPSGLGASSCAELEVSAGRRRSQNLRVLEMVSLGFRLILFCLLGSAPCPARRSLFRSTVAGLCPLPPCSCESNPLRSRSKSPLEREWSLIAIRLLPAFFCTCSASLISVPSHRLGVRLISVPILSHGPVFCPSQTPGERTRRMSYGGSSASDTNSTIEAGLSASSCGGGTADDQTSECICSSNRPVAPALRHILVPTSWRSTFPFFPC